jgi:hypothetical protein
MTKTTPKKLSRRDAIKLLGAAAGATLLANLPSKWSKPALTSGVLPAHAQTSASILHTLTCAPTAAGVNFSQSNPSSVTIFPATSGISMTYLITANATIINPSSATGTVLTIGTGTASVDVRISTGTTTFYIVQWSFANPADGTGTCTQLFSFD